MSVVITLSAVEGAADDRHARWPQILSAGWAKTRRVGGTRPKEPTCDVYSSI